MLFLEIKNKSTSFLDVNLNFSQSKLDLHLSFYEFLTYADFEVKKKIKHDYVCICFS